MSYKLAGVIWNDDGTVATKKLTLQELELLNTASAYNGEQHKAICGRAALELIEYKKIEDELGIDLRKLGKALKIIKEKNVNVRAFKKALLMRQDELSAYNSQNHRYEDDLTQEEFDLLKELLL